MLKSHKWAHLGRSHGVLGPQRQQQQLCGSFLPQEATIGQRESRCPRSCQSDAAPLFPEQPEGEPDQALSYATNSAGRSKHCSGRRGWSRSRFFNDRAATVEGGFPQRRTVTRCRKGQEREVHWREGASLTGWMIVTKWMVSRNNLKCHNRPGFKTHACLLKRKNIQSCYLYWPSLFSRE